MSEVRNCVLCNKELHPVDNFGWSTNQPYAGGQIQLLFCYGSVKFDLYPTATSFTGLICDDCAVPLVEKMEKTQIPRREFET